MFPPSDPVAVRAKLEAISSSNAGMREVHLSYPPLVYRDGHFSTLPMDRHATIGKVEDDGLVLRMGKGLDPTTELPSLRLPLIPPSVEAKSRHFSKGLPLRVPYTAIIDTWLDERPGEIVNIWLRHAVVMVDGWTLVPFVWAPAVAQRPE